MEDFVSIKIAKKLKEKGFDWETSNVYERNTIACRYEDYPKPTISQVLKWLRDKKNIVFGITPMQEMDGDYLSWCITILKVADDGYGLSFKEELYYDSYESTALAGIEYVLDNLI